MRLSVIIRRGFLSTTMPEDNTTLEAILRSFMLLSPDCFPAFAMLYGGTIFQLYLRRRRYR
jgi:hypothetical protein